ncbi:MAG: DUF835 domain-containing protein [Candidatus Altiarchaeota archaeon]
MPNTIVAATNVLTWVTWSFPFIVLTMLSYNIEVYTKYRTQWRLFLVALVSGILYSALKTYDYWKYGDTFLSNRIIADLILLLGTSAAAYASVSLLRFQKISIGKTKATCISLGIIGVGVPLLAYVFRELSAIILLDLIAYNLSIILLVIVYLSIGKIARNYIPEYHNIVYASARFGSVLLLVDPSLRTYYYVSALDISSKYLTRFTGVMFDLVANLLLIFCAAMLMQEAKIRGMHLTPKKEKVKDYKPKYRLKEGHSYLVRDPDHEKSFEIFLDLISKGHYGFCISRLRPTEVRERYNLRTTPILWLTDGESDEKSVKPTDLKRLRLIIKDFISHNIDSVILLQRLDYLIVQNSFEDVLRFIQSLNDSIMSGRCILLVSVNPDTLKLNELSLLYQELHNVSGADSIVLPEKSYELLEFVHNENRGRKMPSFVDVTSRFSITKTTARSRITELESKGLLKVIKDGKYKLLEVTERGKKILTSPVGPEGGE